MKLTSGQEYSLAEIFAEGHEISIPDLQRDYCWGIKNYGASGKQQEELVSAFLDSIRSAAEQHNNSETKQSIGLIYAYEWPKATYQLCDGQQRLTTLFLLCGMLYRHVTDPKTKSRLKKLLSRSDNARGLNTSSLRYGIRESSLHFLDSLVADFFLAEGAHDLKFNIKDQWTAEGMLRYADIPDWYCREYDLDPTIQAMLGTLHTIKNFLKNVQDPENLTKFVMHNMTFIYYDMGSRTKGEKTFVVINNTGEPLSATENLKPQFIARVDKESQNEYTMQWEAREDFFWKIVNDHECSSDVMSYEFYDMCFYILHGKGIGNKNTLKSILEGDVKSELDEIEKIFKVVKSIRELLSQKDNAVAKIFTKLTTWKPIREDTGKAYNWYRTAERNKLMYSFVKYVYLHGFGEKTVNYLRLLAKDYLYNQDVTLDSLMQDVDQSEKRLPAEVDETLLNMELNDHVRLDIDFLLVDKPQKDLLAQRVANLEYLASLCKEKEDLIDIENSNLYRALRVLRNWGCRIGHQYNTSWDRAGRNVNDTADFNSNHDTAYKSTHFFELLDAESKEDLNCRLKKSLADYINKHSDILKYRVENFDVEHNLKSWVYAKMLAANNASIQLIPEYDKFLTLAWNAKENRLNVFQQDSIANSVAKYAKRGGADFISESLWRESQNVTYWDSPLIDSLSGVTYSMFEAEREAESIPVEIIEEVENHILLLHTQFLESIT